MIALRQIIRKINDMVSRVELSRRPRSVSKRSEPSFKEVDIKCQTARPTASSGTSERAPLFPTSPMAIDEPAIIAARDAADHHGPNFVRAY